MSGAEHAGTLERSESESRRFGLEIYRGAVESIDPRRLFAELVAKSVDVAFLRLPADRLAELPRLDRAGVPHLVADTLVYYFADLATAESRPLRNSDLEFVELEPALAPVLDELVGEIFATYVNHYAANPYLGATDRLEGYKEWARGFAAGPSAAQHGWLVRRAGRWVAFCTCAVAGDSGVGILYGIRPDASGGGLYGDLIRFTREQFRARGLREMEVSTQVHNFAVQKVWSREGFTMKKAVATVHLNPLLSASVRAPVIESFSVSGDTIEAWGELSGDRNPLHFSDAFARERGFDGRIAHGIAATAAISRHYGMRDPGPGTLFQGFQFAFLRPIYPDRSYRLSFRTPFVDATRGYHRAVARVDDADGNLCLIGYGHLVRR